MESRALLDATPAPQFDIQAVESDLETLDQYDASTEAAAATAMGVRADPIGDTIKYINDNFKGDGIQAGIVAALNDAFQNGKINYGNTGTANGNYDPNTGIITINSRFKNDPINTAFELIHEGTHAALEKSNPKNGTSLYEEYLTDVYVTLFWQSTLKPDGVPSDSLSKNLNPDGFINSDTIYNGIQKVYAPKNLPATTPQLQPPTGLPKSVILPAVLKTQTTTS